MFSPDGAGFGLDWTECLCESVLNHTSRKHVPVVMKKTSARYCRSHRLSSAKPHDPSITAECWFNAVLRTCGVILQAEY